MSGVCLSFASGVCQSFAYGEDGFPSAWLMCLTRDNCSACDATSRTEELQDKASSIYTCFVIMGVQQFWQSGAGSGEMDPSSSQTRMLLMVRSLQGWTSS